MKKFVLHYAKFTKPLSFHTRFPKSGPTHSRQVLNPQHQTPQGQSITNHDPPPTHPPPVEYPTRVSQQQRRS